MNRRLAKQDQNSQAPGLDILGMGGARAVDYAVKEMKKGAL